jgi:hypothetical protein
MHCVSFHFNCIIVIIIIIIIIIIITSCIKQWDEDAMSVFKTLQFLSLLLKVKYVSYWLMCN